MFKELEIKFRSLDKLEMTHWMICEKLFCMSFRPDNFCTQKLEVEKSRIDI